jgi:predicted amidohydrolase YtcJ
MRAMLQTLSEYGVTALYDAGTKEFSDRVYAFLSKLDKAGELPLRYEGTYRISIPQNAKLAIPEMKRFREAYGGERLKFNTVKLFMDGIHENRSGALLEPYADNPDHVSDTTLSIEELKDFLLELHEEQFDLHVHVIGDLATKRVLDALELAKTEVGEDFYPRVSLGHLQTVDPGDWPRFRELGVSANFTPWWHGFDDPEPIGRGLGEVRDNNTFLARPIADAGGNVTFSSDTWTLKNLSPFLGIQNGHTRQYPREWLTPEQDPEAIRQPESEKLPIELLIRGYTKNGAYQLRMEDSLGSIETGKAADLVILKENLFETDPYAIHQIRPDAVVMEGALMQGNLD